MFVKTSTKNTKYKIYGFKVKIMSNTFFRAKYIHQLVIESYNFYSSAKPCSKFSTLALFDGITKLSSPMEGIYPAESSSETNITPSETSAKVGNGQFACCFY